VSSSKAHNGANGKYMETPQTPKEDAPKEPTPKGTGGEQTPPETPPAGTEPKPEPVDYEKKFSNSTTENQRILAEKAETDKKNAELEAKLADKASETPSDEELRRRYPDWDLLDENGQSAIKRELDRENRVRKLEEQAGWDKDFVSLLKQSEFASLKGKEAEFKEYAYTNPTVKSLSILAQSFLYKQGGKVEPPPPPKRKGLETPTKGTPAEVSTSELTLEQVRDLRKEQPRRYAQMVRDGKFKNIPEAKE